MISLGHKGRICSCFLSLFSIVCSVTEAILLSMKEYGLYARFVDSMNSGGLKMKRLSEDLHN